MNISCFPRYFQCPPKFGLFAPIHKVIRIGFPSTSPAKAKKTKRMAMGVSALTHSPSSSSISSVSSVASSVGGRPSRSGLVSVGLGRGIQMCGGEEEEIQVSQSAPDLLWLQASLILQFLNKDESVYLLIGKLIHLHLLLFLNY